MGTCNLQCTGKLTWQTVRTQLPAACVHVCCVVLGGVVFAACSMSVGAQQRLLCSERGVREAFSFPTAHAVCSALTIDWASCTATATGSPNVVAMEELMQPRLHVCGACLQLVACCKVLGMHTLRVPAAILWLTVTEPFAAAARPPLHMQFIMLCTMLVHRSAVGCESAFWDGGSVDCCVRTPDAYRAVQPLQRSTAVQLHHVRRGLNGVLRQFT